jgi:hypothetical protein
MEPRKRIAPPLPSPADLAPVPRKYVLKPAEFTAVNAPAGTDAPSDVHEVRAILQAVRAREAELGLGEVTPAPPRHSRRKRDFLLLLAAGNGAMLALFLLEVFLGFQVMCLAAQMPGQFDNLVRYAMHEGRPMFFLPALCMAGYTTALWWLMFGVMSDY